VHLVEYPLSGEIGKVAEAFLNKLKSARRSELTINEHRRMLSYFIEGLSLKSKNKLTEITESDIIDFIDSVEHCKDKHYNIARLFSRYLYEEKYIERNIDAKPLSIYPI